MKIFLAQQNYHIGNFEANTGKILAAMEKARQGGADLAVFSELSICGYPPGDFLEFDHFIAACRSAVDQICALTGDLGVILGAPAVNPSPKGKRLFNAAWLLHQGKVQQVVHKTLLPTYDVFDENRYFEPADHWDIVEFRGVKIALTICEDIWNLGDNPLYRICPMDQLMDQHPDLMINISASPFDYLQKDTRREIIRRNVLKYGLPMVYCNAVGAQTEIIYDGASLVLDRHGEIQEELPCFEEAYAGIDIHFTRDGRVFSQEHAAGTTADRSFRAAASGIPEWFDPERNIPGIHDALILGIRDYFNKMGFSQAVIGSSGGIDSAVTLALAVEALGKKQVHALLMPSPFTSQHAIIDAQALSANLDNPYEIIRIDSINQAFLLALETHFQGIPTGLAEENLQARIRGALLMAVANKFGYILLNTSNKSELSTGYGTLYGDMAGGLSVLGDIYKTQVYALARYLNRGGGLIPGRILDKAPSAELRAEQKDTDTLPEYDQLDKVLFEYIEKRQGPREIIHSGFDAALVSRILNLVNASEYKRNQFCPVIRVSVKAFGVGRRMPIVGKYLS
ncbi:MAG TPA: NAD+ synthase [Chitinophagaceae bacterium]|nr:NAD+ synthase [Chitinophagaceae bacterium]